MRGEKFHTNGLRYYCNQNIENFQKTENGSFCSICNKNLIDFRNKTQSEYNEIIAKEKDGCGIFYSYQIGDEVEIKINWKKPLMILSLYSILSFGKSVQAQPSSETKIELADSTKSTLNHSNPLQSKTNSQTDSKSLKPAKKKKETHYKPKRRLYLSGKFPFIHYDRHKMIGVGYW